jgi:hypothetical protein
MCLKSEKLNQGGQIRTHNQFNEMMKLFISLTKKCSSKLIKTTYTIIDFLFLDVQIFKIRNSSAKTKSSNYINYSTH